LLTSATSMILIIVTFCFDFFPRWTLYTSNHTQTLLRLWVFLMLS